MKGTMLAAVYYAPEDIRLEERPIPTLQEGDLLVKVIYASICATDLRIWHGAHRKFPPGTQRIPGHEVVGEIVESRATDSEFAIGQRVFIAPNIGCGHCRHCVSGNNNRCPQYQAIGITLDGGFAEYLRVPAAFLAQGNVLFLNQNVELQGAALIEPFACVLRGQEALHILPGETVLVIGAGPIGVMHLLLAKLRGAGKVLVSEVIPERLNQAAHFGATRVINPLQEDLPAIVFAESGREGAEVVIVAAPAHQAQQDSIELAAPGGRINFFGGLPKEQPTISMDANLVHYKELIVTGTTGCSSEDCQKAARLVLSGQINLTPLVGAVFPLRQINQALVEAEKKKTLKVVIQP